MTVLPAVRQHLKRALSFIPALLAACTSPPGPSTSAPAPAVVAPPGSTPPPVSGQPAPGVPLVSGAPTPRAYRQDAAGHLYRLHRERVWQGRMPPMLYAIGVLEVDVDARGDVRRVNWLRAPRHAPEVMAEIERMVRGAAPFPVPARLGRVTYTDTWLWHRSGRFQLDTLTEGQD